MNMTQLAAWAEDIKTQATVEEFLDLMNQNALVILYTCKRLQGNRTQGSEFPANHRKNHCAE